MNEAEVSAASLLAVSVVGALAVDSAVILSVAPNVRTAPGTNAVVASPVVGNVVDLVVVDVMHQEVEGCATGGE